MELRVDEEGREWQKVTMDDGTEHEIEIGKVVIDMLDEENRELGKVTMEDGTEHEKVVINTLDKGSELQKVTMEDETEPKIKKVVIVTAEESKKKIKDYKEKVKEAKLKVWNEYNIQEPVVLKPRFQPSPPVFNFG